ncbi:MAG: DNA mismatch repair endonuclease MutL [Patescibacteria group bacterium]|nr:DNA mismatch repair endonuclease MutL [Patescibacteria group bacterium]
MNKIAPLSPEVIHKIAAGEVIERPAYAVKELLENALDAKSTQIDILLEHGGIRRIAVHDNGIGMTKEDLSLCWMAHTTSKISSESDFSSIQTLGFRGEALHSIATVSRVRIRSRRRGSSSGSEIIVDRGKHLETRTVGMPEGSSIIVDDLFSGLPARKKFLKSPQTELRHILDVVLDVALAWPETGFSVEHNGRLLLAVPIARKLLDRIAVLFGPATASLLFEVSANRNDTVVTGLAAKPLNDGAPQRPVIILNRRRVELPAVSSAVRSAYGSLLEARHQPFVVLHITVPPHHVDVNVHPRKEQVALLNERVIAEDVYRAISDGLAINNLTYFPDRVQDGGTKTYAAAVIRREVEAWGTEPTTWKKSGDVLQIHNLYLAVETAEGIMLVDQHAAHERILYEQYRDAFLDHRENLESVQISPAVTIEVSVAEAVAIEEYAEVFEGFGFDVELFGYNVVKVNSLPALLRDRDAAVLIRELLSDLSAGLTPRQVDSRSDRMLSYLACRSAIKAGEKLTKEQAKKLIERLLECKTEYTCPHGRPIKAVLSIAELGKIFRRR